MFARQSRRFPTQNRATGRFEGRKLWRPRGKACFDIRQRVWLYTRVSPPDLALHSSSPLRPRRAAAAEHLGARNRRTSRPFTLLLRRANPRRAMGYLLDHRATT